MKLEETNPWARVAGLALALPVIIALMLFAFLAPSQASSPAHLPLAVFAPEPAGDMVAGGRGQGAGHALALPQLASADEVTEQVLNRESLGGVVLGQEMSITIYQASGNGAPYGQILDGMAQ